MKLALSGNLPAPMIGAAPSNYDEACRAIAEAKTFDEVRDWEDKAAAVREYGRRARHRSVEIDALEIRERARRRRGELLLDLKGTGRLAEGRKRTVTARGQFADRLTLAELDTSQNELARDQKTAALDSDEFERLIARCRAYMEEHPEKHSFAAVPKDGIVNGARAVMGSRRESVNRVHSFADAAVGNPGIDRTCPGGDEGAPV